MNSFNFTDVRENHTISVDFAESPVKDKNSAATAERPAQTDGKEEQKEDIADKDQKTDQNKKEEKEDQNDDKDKNGDKTTGKMTAGGNRRAG